MVLSWIISLSSVLIVAFRYRSSIVNVVICWNWSHSWHCFCQFTNMCTRLLFTSVTYQMTRHAVKSKLKRVTCTRHVHYNFNWILSFWHKCTIDQKEEKNQLQDSQNIVFTKLLTKYVINKTRKEKLFSSNNCINYFWMHYIKY